MIQRTDSYKFSDLYTCAVARVQPNIVFKNLQLRETPPSYPPGQGEDLHFFFLFKIYLLCIIVFCLHVRKGIKSQYRWFWATTWLLGIELKTSGRTSSALSLRHVSSPDLCFLKELATRVKYEVSVVGGVLTLVSRSVVLHFWPNLSPASHSPTAASLQT